MLHVSCMAAVALTKRNDDAGDRLYNATWVLFSMNGEWYNIKTCFILAVYIQHRSTDTLASSHTRRRHFHNKNSGISSAHYYKSLWNNSPPLLQAAAPTSAQTNIQQLFTQNRIRYPNKKSDSSAMYKYKWKREKMYQIPTNERSREKM